MGLGLALSACSSCSVLCLSPKPAWLGWYRGAGTGLSMAKLGLLPSAPLACLSPSMAAVCSAGPAPPSLSPPGLCGLPALLCCHPAQFPHSAEALESLLGRGDPRAMSAEPCQAGG